METILRTSAWRDDDNNIQMEVVWEKADGSKGVARMALPAEAALGFAEKLRCAASPSPVGTG